MRNTARIAVVGGGWWATTAHLPAVTQNPDAELAAIVEPDPDRRAAAAERFQPGAAFASLEAMLAETEVDGVVVAAPHALHYPLARLALEAGKHVLLEKPMVIDPAHGEALVELARARGVELLMGYPYHYNRQMLEVRARIAAGEIGTIEHVSSLFASTVRAFYSGDPEAYREAFGFEVNPPLPDTYSTATTGGQGQSQVTHSAALLLWLTGLEPAAVSAFTANSGLEVDISDSVAIEFRSGAVGVLSSTGTVSQHHPELLEYRIFGDGGHAVLDVNEGTGRILRADGSALELDPLPEADRYPMFAPATNLIDVVLGRGDNGSPAEVGLATARVVAGMYASAASRRSVALDSAQAPQNIGHVWRVAPGRAEEYRRRHATVWPEVERLLRDYGVRAYTIYAWGEILFSHMEVDDYLHLATRYGGDPIAARWEQEMGDLLEYPNADPVTGMPELLPEVWSL